MNKLKRFLEVLVASSFLTGAFFVTNAMEEPKSQPEKLNDGKTTTEKDSSKKQDKENYIYDICFDYFFEDAGMDYDLFESRLQKNPDKADELTQREIDEIFKKKDKTTAACALFLYLKLEGYRKKSGYDFTKNFSSTVTNYGGELGVNPAHWICGVTDKNDIDVINKVLAEDKKGGSDFEITKENFEIGKEKLKELLFGEKEQNRISVFANALKKGPDKNGAYYGTSRKIAKMQITNYKKGVKDLLNVKFEDVEKLCKKFKHHGSVIVEKHVIKGK